MHVCAIIGGKFVGLEINV